ncbi:Thymidylate kinase [Cardinium endosymbiont cEper1 of Encarsia pergandiella]|uniref:dTMP kinase n=1 Tax=Cardinium endosymbiont of Encarsia pergandiella TaxID=249402 RepID=UPI00027E9C03|nr:dTMP kinase [Cardinium endosymbiont of Encarsia pergandiella]CCM09992.1 Thymidylate kinase [Cardinium endosymbiont cEper1 of Encarsia pergandiella]
MENRITPTQRRIFTLVIEGVDFAGKTTLAHQIQASLINQSYHVKLLHDPKGSKNAQLIWDTILTIKNEDAHPITEFFLFLAARHELIAKEALVGAADVLIFDRFIFSTIAYQLTHQPDYWAPFLTTHRIFSSLMPDLCIYCDIDFDTFQLRNQSRSNRDAFDQMSQKRFEAIKKAYEQTLELKLCPYIQVNQGNNDHSTLIQNIIKYISMEQPRYTPAK